jgi:SAM-dependent MidA family methyltransferase
MERALYGPDGFFRRSGPGPAGHFRTSAHASPLFAAALARLLVQVDDALDRPARLDVVDIGAGRGELLTALLAALPAGLAGRVAATAVEVAPRPAHLPGDVAWSSEPPEHVSGLLIATEWLDNVPLDVVEVDDHGTPRYVCVDERGSQWLDGPVDRADAAWLERWWSLGDSALRAEIGAPRDAAWAAAVSTVDRGLALAVDYGHFAAARPRFGTLIGYRAGREVPAVPDGSCDLTAAVAVDAVAAAGAAVSGVPPAVVSQREALRGLGVDGGRPPLSLASADPAAYVRALSRASGAAELTDPAGLGGHWWLLQWR